MNLRLEEQISIERSNVINLKAENIVLRENSGDKSRYLVDSLTIGGGSLMKGDFRQGDSQITSGVNQSGLGGVGTGSYQGATQSNVQGGLNTGVFSQGSSQIGGGVGGGVGGGYGQGNVQAGSGFQQSGGMRGDYGSASQMRGDFNTGSQIRGGQIYGASTQGGLGGQGIQGIQGATLTTSAIKQGISESGITSPEAYKQFQSPSSTAMKLEDSKFERSYDIGSASRYNTPGTREWKR